MDDLPWQFDMSSPLWLIALAVLPLVVHYAFRSLVQFGRWQRAASLVIRAVLVVLLVIALCRVGVIARSEQQFVVFVVDESLSIAEESRRAAKAFLDEAVPHGGDNQMAFLPFAAAPGDVGARGSKQPPLDRQGTNLVAAMLMAEAVIPATHVPRIVLLSDGNQTSGDALATAGAARMPIWTVPLPGCPDNEIYVSAVETTTQVRQGEPFYVEVVVQSTRESDGTVRLLEGTEPVVTETKHVTEGENRFRLRHTLTGESEAILTADVGGFKDTLPENNRASALVFITDRPRVLLVEGRPDCGRLLAEALKRQYIDVETRRPEKMPGRAAELEEYELLMLSNVPAAALTAGRMEAVRQYVRDFGGGLIVVGGDRSLTAGGYRDTVLEEVLPVRCDVRKDRPKPSLAMVLVIDRSGSMEGESIELAKLATRQAVEKLAPSDQVGVIAFEDDSRWVSQGIRPCSERESVIENLAGVTAGGGTNLYPAMEKAYLALHEAFADRKHMIVLSDGLSHPGDFEALTREIAAAGITVSTVAMGEQAAEQLLQDIARRGRGHYHYCRSAASLPGVFVLEATTAGKLGVIEKLVSPQAAALGEVYRDVELGEVPPLLGYVQTVARPNGQLALSAENNDPLLVWWKHGRGVSVAFTSAVQESWAPLWLDWPGLGPFWAQLVRHAMRKEEAPGFMLHVERSDGRARLTLDAVDDDDQYINGAEAVLEIVDPSDESHQVPMPQVAPGRYAAEFDTPVQGPYRLEATLSHSDGASYVGRRGLVVGYADEFRVGPTNKDLLRQIAETTGGRYNRRPAEVFAPPEDPGLAVRRTTACWPYLLIAAALIFLVDVALKRIDLSSTGLRDPYSARNFSAVWRHAPTGREDLADV